MRIISKMHLFIWACLVSVVSVVHAAEKPKTIRTLSFDSGYLPMTATPRSGHQLWKEYEGLGSLVFDGVSFGTPIGSNALTRLLWGAGYGFVWRYANYPFFVGNHELGHGSRAVAAGGSPRYQWTGGTQHVSIFSFIADGFARYGSGASTASNWSLGPSNWTIAVSAAGMNNSMMFVERLQEDAFYRGGHILESVAYYLASTDAYFYAVSTDAGFAGDVSALIQQWSAAGTGVSTADFRTGSLIAALGSATTWAYLWSTLRYIAVGDPTVHGLALGPVRLPDVAFFANRGGISYRLKTAIDVGGGGWIPLSVETQVRGPALIEGSVGYRKQSKGSRSRGGFGAVTFQGFANTAAGLGVRVVDEMVLSQSLVLTLGAGVFTVNSLEGERSMDRLVNANLGFDAWGRISALF